MATEARDEAEATELQPITAKAPAIAVTAADLESRSSPTLSDPSRTPTPSSSVPHTPTSNPLTPATSQSSGLSVTPEPGDSGQPDAHDTDGSTLIASSEPSENGRVSTTSPVPVSTIDPPPSRAAQRRFGFLPDLHNSKHVLAVGVCAMTIATVVYSRRSYILESYNNALEYYQYCQTPNVNDPGCNKIDGPLKPPPYNALGLFGSHSGWDHNTNVRREQHDLATHVSFAQLMWLLAGGGTLLLSAIAITRYYMHRREQRQHAELRLSDQSMARQDLTDLDQSHQIIDEPQQKGGVRRHYRAFVTAEQAINQMKSANSSHTSLGQTLEQASSDISRRRRSWLPGSTPSILDNATVYAQEGDGDDNQLWQKVRRLSSTSTAFSSSISSLSSPPSAHKPTRLPATSEESDETPKSMRKLKRWLSPGPIRVLDQPIPELQSGDVDGAVAFVGAGLAATTGGRAMSRCPVEVPFDGDKGLPDSWMHISPQDSSSVGAVPCG